MKEAVIVTALRTAVGKAPRGSLKNTRPDELASTVIKEVVKRSGIDPKIIDDVIFGCAFPEGVSGMNMARIAVLKAGLPTSVPAMTLNRFCSSGVQSIAIAAEKIMAGFADCVIAGGAESMSMIPMGGVKTAPDPYLMKNHPGVYLSMGLTAEEIASRYKIGRQEQDKFAYESQMKAAKALKENRFADEIIPVKTTVIDRNQQIQEIVFDTDEGVRPETTIEGLSKLKPAFKVGGTVTAGNSSQTSDAAAAVLVMSGELALKLGFEPLGIFRSFAVGGVDPEVMGLGPTVAIPKALKIAGLKLEDIDLIELNEAFAVQVIADLKEDVARDIAIRSSANLEDLHNTITNAFGFGGTEMASFYKADNEWNQGEEIPLYDISEEPTSDTTTMKDFALKDLFVEQEDKLIYVYDFFAMWTFLVELIEIKTYNNEQDLPKVLYTLGNLPDEAPEKNFEGKKIGDGFDMYDNDDADNEDFSDYDEYNLN